MSKTTRTTTRVAALAASLALVVVTLGAAPASAATHTAHYHKPKSFVCAVFGVCKYITHCYKSNPYTAAVKPRYVDGRICWAPHVDAY